MTSTAAKITTVLMYVAYSANAFADPTQVQRFKTDYGSAASKLEEQYSQVTMSGELRQSDDQGKFLYASQVEFLRDGNAFRKREVAKSARDKAIIDTQTVTGGRSEKFFDIFKRAGAADFTFNSFGKKSETEFTSSLWFYAQPLCSVIWADAFICRIT